MRLTRYSARLVAASRLAFSMVVCALLLAVIDTADAASEKITVLNSRILRNGIPWVPKGVVIVGLVAPAAQISGAYADARKQFGAAELKSVADYGADLIRFQVSQGGADPKSPIYSAAYVQEVVRGVQLARSHGFVVIVSIQSGKPSGGNDPNGLPGDSTRRAWHDLAPLFSSDDGIMFELFNEPSRQRGAGPGAPDPTWADWRNAHQMLIDEIRSDGAHNAIIADGLEWAHTLQGVPILSDPDSDLIYAVHPYPHRGYLSSADWDEAFGIFAGTHPVLATEWNARAAKRCDPNFPAIAAEFLAYAKVHNIGVVGWAFDLPDTLFDSTGSPTNYRNFSCQMTGPSGIGELLHSSFLQNR